LLLRHTHTGRNAGRIPRAEDKVNMRKKTATCRLESECNLQQLVGEFWRHKFLARRLLALACLSGIASAGGDSHCIGRAAARRQQPPKSDFQCRRWSRSTFVHQTTPRRWWCRAVALAIKPTLLPHAPHGLSRSEARRSLSRRERKGPVVKNNESNCKKASCTSNTSDIPASCQARKV